MTCNLATALGQGGPAGPPRPPGPRGLPFLGNSLDFLRDALGFPLRLRARYGTGVVHVRLGGLQTYLVSEPALIEQVMVTDSRDYRKDSFLQWLGDELLGQGLLTSDGDLWRRQRRLAQPAFHRERIAGYGALMVAEAERLCETWRGGGRRDLHADMMHLTLRIVTRALFSSDVGDVGGEAEVVGRALDVITARYADGLLASVPLLRRLPLPANRRFHTARARLDAIVYGLIRRRRQAPGGQGDLLDMLLSARDEDGGAMSDVQLRDEVITVFLAGHETTALALSYAFLLLTRSSGAAGRLQQELAEVLGGRSPTPEDLPRLRYAEGVMLEALRLYPPAWALGREAVREVALGGYRLPAGAQLWFSPWAMHRDERYFDAPHEFRPERWEDGLQKRLPRYAYFPFGGGPRLCIGREFAMLEAVLLLATLAGRYRVAVERPESVRFLPSVTLRPRGPLWARIERRGAQGGRAS